MRLIQVKISGYKHLQDMTASFVPPEESGLFQGGVPVRFLIGLNGSGKSAFLEGLCLIFSCLAQDEMPGFPFSVRYEIQRDGVRWLVQASGDEAGRLAVRAAAERPEDAEEVVLTSFTGHRDLLPDCVFVCASGNHNNFFDLAVRAPREALHGALFDASTLGKGTDGPRQRLERLNGVLQALRRLEENPICMFVDERTSVLALAAFLAVLPEGEGADGDGLRCREQILNVLDSRPLPLSFSLTVDPERLDALHSQDKTGGLFDELVRELPEDRRLSAWTTDRMDQDQEEDGSRRLSDQVMTFLFEGGEPGRVEEICVKSLSERCHTPIQLLSQLLRAQNQGIIKQAHLGIRLRGTGDVLEENALSEGEYMLLVRLALLAMGRYSDGQYLYLLDEPDVYLNERWNIDFVAMLHQIYQGVRPRHDILVATHSSLILTDAFPEQLYYFRTRDGRAECLNVQASTFGGNRNEIMQALFRTRRSVGSFSYERIQQLLEQAQSADMLEEQLKNVGSGYLRLRLLDQIQRLREEGR